MNFALLAFMNFALLTTKVVNLCETSLRVEKYV